MWVSFLYSGKSAESDKTTTQQWLTGRHIVAIVCAAMMLAGRRTKTGGLVVHGENLGVDAIQPGLQNGWGCHDGRSHCRS